MKKKLALTITSIALVAALAIGGTLAYLTSTSKTVTNTFIASPGITALVLDESKYENGALIDERTQANSYTMVPTAVLPKDPKVSITTVVDSYLFINVTDKNASKYLDYSVRTGAGNWEALAGEDGVYYRTVQASTDTPAAAQEFYILTGGTDKNQNGQVTVKNVEMKDVATDTPELIFNAYAIQTADGLDAKGAWDAVKNLAPADDVTPAS